MVDEEMMNEASITFATPIVSILQLSQDQKKKRLVATLMSTVTRSLATFSIIPSKIPTKDISAIVGGQGYVQESCHRNCASEAISGASRFVDGLIVFVGLA